MFFTSILLSSDIKEYTKALEEDDFVKVNEIYQSKLGTEEFSNYQNKYFNLITKNIFLNPNKSQELIDNIETFEYDNPDFKYIQANLAASKNEYIKALEILYKLKNDTINYNLQVKVKELKDLLLNNYLLSLYEKKDYDSLLKSIDLFIIYNDREARDLWQKTILKAADKLVENKSFKISMGLLEKSNQYYLNQTNQKNFQLVNNNLAYYYLKDLEQKEDLDTIEEYIKYLNKIKDIDNITYAKKIKNKIEQKLYIASIQGTKIPLEKKGNQYYLKAYINGVKVIFLLDTGASKTMVNNSIASRFAGKLVQENIPIYTALGRGRADLIVVDNFVVDSVSLGEFELIVSKKDVFRYYDGLLGMNFLNQFHFQIDTLNKQLILN